MENTMQEIKVRDRIRFDENDCYYHIMNHAVYMQYAKVWKDVDKEMLMRMMKNLSLFYTVEIISFCIMSNHYHLVVHAPKEVPGLEEVKRRWRAYNDTKGEWKSEKEPDWNDEELVDTMAKRMRNISWLASDLQRFFSIWYNDKEKRRGTLWAKRFKSVVLEQGRAVWECIKYVEMNPLRAKLVKDSADYRFSSFGEYCGTGKHPFLTNFSRHLRYYWGDEGKYWSPQEVCDELMKVFNECFMGEAKLVYDDNKSTNNYKNKPNSSTKDVELVTKYRKCKHFTQGKILGSKLFIFDKTGKFFGAEKQKKMKLEEISEDGELNSYGKLPKP